MIHDDPVRVSSAEPRDIQLLLPECDAEDPEVSVVVPALNEASTITDFVAWCHEGFAVEPQGGGIDRRQFD